MGKHLQLLNGEELTQEVDYTINEFGHFECMTCKATFESENEIRRHYEEARD